MQRSVITIHGHPRAGKNSSKNVILGPVPPKNVFKSTTQLVEVDNEDYLRMLAIM